MRLRNVVTAALIFCPSLQSAPASTHGAAQQPPRRPNVVLVLMDDMGYGDIGSYGVTDARTPNLDRLAREGVRLTDAYANGAVCSPTRAALLTGRYQQRVGVEWAFKATYPDLPVTGNALPALLKRNGYATGLFGKWHLGFKPDLGPNAHGFDEFFGFLSGEVDYYTHRRDNGTPDLYENTAPVESPTYLTDEITRRAVNFIDRRSASPFFLEVAYNAVHSPFQPPDLSPSQAAVLRNPAAATRQDYIRMLERADAGVGQILAALDQHALSANTLVIFTNDNGGERYSRNAPFSKGKGGLWEGGIRVPLILRWPARLPAGKTSAHVAITMDLTASILAATDSAVPPSHRLDGIDILPFLQGDSSNGDRALFWRIVEPNWRQQKAVRAGQWKLLVDDGQFLLFDVRADPAEKQNLAGRRPDLVLKLKAALEAWEKDVDQKSQTRP